MISFRQKGNFSKTIKYFNNTKRRIQSVDFDKYGKEGVTALASATPVESGLTASSWNYTVIRKHGSVSISFYNSNIQNGVPIAIILQYGHGTRNGGWVEGIDYINPSIQPIFNGMVNSAWREVTKV